MPMTRTTISFTRDGMALIQEAAKRQGSSVSQFVREAALMRAAMAVRRPTRTRCATSPRSSAAIGDQGHALAEQALRCRQPGGRPEAVTL